MIFFKKQNIIRQRHAFVIKSVFLCIYFFVYLNFIIFAIGFNRQFFSLTHFWTSMRQTFTDCLQCRTTSAFAGFPSRP